MPRSAFMRRLLPLRFYPSAAGGWYLALRGRRFWHGLHIAYDLTPRLR